MASTLSGGEHYPGEGFSVSQLFISKHDIHLFAYFDYLVLFPQSPCHLDASKTSKFGLGLYK